MANKMRFTYPEENRHHISISRASRERERNMIVFGIRGNRKLERLADDNVLICQSL